MAKNPEYCAALFRDSEKILSRRDGGRWELVFREDDNTQLRALLADPDASFPGREQALKNGNTCTVWAAEVDGLSLVIKRYNVKSFWHGLKLSTRRGRALHSWENAFLLREHGIPTPRPVAVVKFTDTPLRPRAYLLTERVDGVGAHSWFRDENRTEEQKRQMVQKVAGLFRQLRQQRISHGDLKAANIMIVDGSPMLLDLDAMCWHENERRFDRSWQQDLHRFLANWEDLPELGKLFKEMIGEETDSQGHS
jgi:tRNA A-37 threonylcarbamoyl transferase component Bud32